MKRLALTRNMKYYSTVVVKSAVINSFNHPDNFLAGVLLDILQNLKKYNSVS